MGQQRDWSESNIINKSDNATSNSSCKQPFVSEFTGNICVGSMNCLTLDLENGLLQYFLKSHSKFKNRLLFVNDI